MYALGRSNAKSQRGPNTLKLVVFDQAKLSHPHRFGSHSMNRHFFRALFFAIVLLPLVSQYNMGLGNAVADEKRDFFEEKIRPIFVKHCYDCHGDGENEGKLSLDSKAGWQRGGERGPAILPGDPVASLLFQVVQHADPKLRMPPVDAGKPLSKSQIADLSQWIRDGAVDPRNGQAIKPIDEQAKGHWAFQKIQKTVFGPSNGKANVKSVPVNPVDYFIDEMINQKQFVVAPQANSATLARRATLDLIGLPPTATQQASAMKNYGNFIDQLLASPRYGERWGRHWLDVARYSDAKDGVLMYGDARIRPFAYTYRDYVIRAFNEDKPFDQFVKEQLAADQMNLPADSPNLAAMGFLTLGRMFDNNPHDVIDDRIDVVSRGLLGLTASCARCHDHKFDPIPTADYYSLYGVFASSKEPLDRPRIGPLTDATKQHENEFEKKLKEIYDTRDTHYRDALIEVRARTPDYLVQVATTKPDYAETAIFFLSLIPGQLRPNITHLWRTLIAKRAFPDDPIFGPWHDLMLGQKLQPDEWKRRGVDPRIIAGLVEAQPRTPREIATAYGKIILDVANQTDKIKDRLVEIEANISMMQSESIHLAGVVAGTNGFVVPASGNGINPADGKPVKGATGFIDIARHDVLIPVPSNEFVDGIFVPKSNAATITTTGIKVDDLLASSGKTWDYFKSGTSSGSTENQIDGVDYSKPLNSMLAIHANKGITFDLQKMRATHHFTACRLQGVFGNSGASGQSQLDFSIYVDGKRVLNLKDFPAQGKGHLVDLELSKSERFLTLVTTEGKQGISHDQAVFGNPRIVMTEREINPQRTITISKLKEEQRQLDLQLQSLPKQSDDPISKLLFANDSPAWFPKSKVDNYLSRQKKDGFRGLLGQLDGISVRHPKAAPRAMILEDTETLFDPVIFQRGDPGQKGNPVPRQFLQILSQGKRTEFHKGSGRLELAEKIVSPDNPLTARVWVNRIWLHHFGEPLVENPSDFGLRTKQPIHLKLLDFLAGYLIESGWKTKKLHKLIMNSKVYQRSSKLTDAPDIAEKLAKQIEMDPGNRYFWKGNRRRMDLEQMRDSMLFVSKSLDERMFGRPTPITDQNNHRRTIYAFVERQNLPAIVQTFDFASADSSVAKRVTTTVPQQALFAMNSEFVHSRAKELATTADQELNASRKVAQLYLAVLGHQPSPEELKIATEFLKTNQTVELAHVLLMTNEFTFID